MKSRRGFWFAFLTAVLFWLGLSAAFVAFQLRTAADHAAPEPQAMSVADLIADGPGDNLHLRLTGVAFGQPLIEQDGGVWERVWLPILPAGATAPGDKTVLLRTHRVANQAQLDGLLKQTELPVLATGALPATSVWKVKPDDELKAAPLKIDFAKTTFLNDPGVVLAGATVLPPEVVYNPLWPWVAWGAAAVLSSLGFFCLFSLFAAGRGRAGKKREDAAPPASEHERGRLAVEIALSVHRFTPGAFFQRAIRHAISGLVFFLLGLLALGVIPFALDTAAPVVAVGFAGASLLPLLGTAWALGRIREMFVGGVSEISVCHSGLRWRVGGRAEQALWTDIAVVDVSQKVVTYRGVVKDWQGICNIRFHGGDALSLWSDAPSDFVGFANLARERHAEVTGAEQRALLNQAVRGGALWGRPGLRGI